MQEEQDQEPFRFSLRTLLSIPLAIALFFGLLHSIAFVVEYASRDQILLKACRQGDIDAARELIASGANVNTRDSWSSTPLKYASSNGHAEIVELLLDAGITVNERSRMARNPLMFASRNGNFDIVELLLKRGAQPDLVDMSGDSALDLALREAHREVANILKVANEQRQSEPAAHRIFRFAIRGDDGPGGTILRSE